VSGAESSEPRRPVPLWPRLVVLSLAVVVLSPATGHAARRGLLMMGDSLAQNALPMQLSFATGQRVDLHRLVVLIASEPYTGTDLFVHDFDTGLTRRADDQVPDMSVVSPFESNAATIGELFAGPGDVVLFESPGLGPLDPLRAERFRVHRPLAGDAVYFPPGTQLIRVPEPGTGSALASGLALIASLARRRLWTR